MKSRGFLIMINLTKGNTETIYFTGTEKITLADPYFLFTFTNRVTEEEVVIFCEDVSTTDRYDKFSVVVNTWFSDSTTGSWDYSIQEYTRPEPSRPQDYALTGTVYGVVVETGRMYLRGTAFAPTQYAGQSNDFKVYNGA